MQNSSKLWRLGFTLFAALACAPAGAPAATPPGDAARGKFVFLQCQACHAPQAGAAPMIGPTLAGVYGSKAAAQPGYSYSGALKNAGITWTAASLETWLTSPSAMVPGTKMAFLGISQPEQRADIIAYLATLH